MGLCFVGSRDILELPHHLLAPTRPLLLSSPGTARGPSSLIPARQVRVCHEGLAAEVGVDAALGAALFGVRAVNNIIEMHSLLIRDRVVQAGLFLPSFLH